MPNAKQMEVATREGMFWVFGNVIIGRPLQSKSVDVVCPFVMGLSKAKSAIKHLFI